MTTHKGYYSLIQYCPDASRAETANVGVLLFCPDLRFIEAKTIREHTRIVKLLGGEGFDPARVNAAKRALEDRLKVEQECFRSLDDLRRFGDSRANEIIVTEPRPMTVSDPKKELDELYRELVGVGFRSKHLSVIPELDRAMHSPELQPLVRFDEEVQVPIVGTRMRVPYTFQNGQPNLIHPTVFQPKETTAVRQAAFLACAGDMLQRHPDSQGHKSRLIVVSANSEPGKARENIEEHVGRVFNEYRIDFVRRSRVDELIERVRGTAHR